MKKINNGKNIFIVISFLFSGMILSAQSSAIIDNANTLYFNRNYQGAVDLCLSGLGNIPPSDTNTLIQFYRILGRSYIHLKNYNKAVYYGNEGKKLAPYDAGVIDILAKAHYYAGNNVLALNYFQQLAALNPVGDQARVVYYFISDIYIRLGEFNHADIALSTALHYSPNIAEWWERLGYVREQTKSFKMAKEAYVKAVTLNPALADSQQGLQRLQAY